MSNATDNAELIRNRILTAPAAGELETLVDLTGIDAIVYRQQSIEAAVNAAVGKASGCAIVIMWEGFRTLAKNASRPRLGETYNVAVWSKPVIDAGQRPAELVIKSIVLRMWQWLPQGGHVHEEVEVTGGGVTPSKSFLIYDCEVTIPNNL